MIIKGILIATLVLLIFLIILILAGNYFYNMSILRRKKDFLKNDPDIPKESSGETWTAGRRWLDTKQYCKIGIKSEDRLSLCAYYLPNSEKTSKTVIFVHGYTGKGKDTASFAQFYHENLGFNVLMPDCRGHGESEGDYIGFGWHDRKDILKWIEYILDKNGKDSQIVLHGISMGGGAVLMTSGEELPNNVRCIISDCAYSSVKDILVYQMKRMYKLPQFPLIQVTSLISKLRAGYYLGEASALKQIKRSKTPILFIHGTKDRYVPTEMVYPLYKAVQCEKQLFLVEGAEHGNAYWTDKEGYRNQVADFIGKYIG
jgi:uncharacterized protein